MGLLGQVQQLNHLEPMLYTNEGAPRATGKVAAPNPSRLSTMVVRPLVRSNRPQPQLEGFVGIWGSKNKIFLPHKLGFLQL